MTTVCCPLCRSLWVGYGSSWGTFFRIFLASWLIWDHAWIENLDHFRLLDPSLGMGNTENQLNNIHNMRKHGWLRISTPWPFHGCFIDFPGVLGKSPETFETKSPMCQVGADGPGAGADDSGWMADVSWLVVWNIFYFPRNIGFLIIPSDELIFFRGVAQPPTSFAFFFEDTNLNSSM